MESVEGFEDAVQAVQAAISLDLVETCVMLLRLLHAVDIYPDGGLYRGLNVQAAITRYWDLWLPLLAQETRPAAATEDAPALRAGGRLLRAPLDVCWVWFVHRLNPTQYVRDCVARFGREVHPVDAQQALAFNDGSHGPEGEHTRKVWEAAYPPSSGAVYRLWPPHPAAASSAESKSEAMAELASSAPPLSTLPPQPSGGTRAAGASSCAAAAAYHEGVAGERTAAAEAARHRADATAELARAERSGSSGGTKQQAAHQLHGPAAAAAAGKAARAYITDAAERQGLFLHQVLRWCYASASFLRCAVARYCQFLALARLRGVRADGMARPMLVPMYDIDLAWHAHMATSGHYAHDTRLLTGALLSHDDSLASGALVDPFEATRQLWQRATSCTYNVTPSRKLPLGVAHPVVGLMWPLAAALQPVGGGGPPAPAQVAADVASALASAGAAAPEADAEKGSGGGGGASGGGILAAAHQQLFKLLGVRQRFALRVPLPAPRMPQAQSQAQGAPNSASPGPAAGSPEHLGRSGGWALYVLWLLAQELESMGAGGGDCAGAGSERDCGGDGAQQQQRKQPQALAPRMRRQACERLAATLAALAATPTTGGPSGSPLRASSAPYLEQLLPLPPREAAPHPWARVPLLEVPLQAGHSATGGWLYMAPHHYASMQQVVYYTPDDYCVLGHGRWCLPTHMESCHGPNMLGRLLHGHEWPHMMDTCYRKFYEAAARQRPPVQCKGTGVPRHIQG